MTKLALDTLIPTISTERDYCFFRTNNGLHFESFLNYNYIAIGWNTITLSDITDTSLQGDIELREKVIAHYQNLDEDFDSETPKGKSKITSTITKLRRFVELKKEDLIIVPDVNSRRLAFGIVDDDETFVYSGNNNFGCDYYKRRKVKWVQQKMIDQLDPVFYKIAHPRHTIFKINERYHDYIDNVTNTIYRKGDYIHFVIDLRVEGRISFSTLTQVLSELQIIIEKIEQKLEILNDEGIEIRLNLQSPGLIELKKKFGVGLVAIALTLSSCDVSKISPELPNIIQNTNEENNSQIVNSVMRNLDTLRMNRDRINIDFLKRQ